MRVWFSGPRLFNGLVRPGISLGRVCHSLRAQYPEALDLSLAAGGQAVGLDVCLETRTAAPK
jgi:hypothetical protein